mgnify:CR=1 FL=1
MKPNINKAHKRRVFSGIQPTGNLTLGNYLGAVKRFVEMQNSGIETIYCMVDLHAITTWQNPSELKAATRELAAGFIASGLDPEKSILFNQSQVRAHSELGWVFNCIARMGWLNRMTQFKEKAGKEKEKASIQKKYSFYQQTVNYVLKLKPRFFIPFAGKYTLAGKLSVLNKWRGNPEQSELISDQALLRQGNTSPVDGNLLKFDSPWLFERAGIVDFKFFLSTTRAIPP